VFAIRKEDIVWVANLGVCAAQNGTLMFQRPRLVRDLNGPAKTEFLERREHHASLGTVDD
jgi:hypothetical protein